jgi:hypothetical protein
MTIWDYDTGLKKVQSDIYRPPEAKDGSMYLNRHYMTILDYMYDTGSEKVQLDMLTY